LTFGSQPLVISVNHNWSHNCSLMPCSLNAAALGI
jgi:hypothetical protein